MAQHVDLTGYKGGPKHAHIEQLVLLDVISAVSTQGNQRGSC